MGEGQGSLYLSLIGGLFLFALVLFLAWYCTKWLGKRYGFQNKGGKIKILERTALGPDRFLMVIRLGEKTCLLGVTAQHIDNLGDVDPDLYPDEDVDTKGFDGLRESGGISVNKFSDELRRITERFSERAPEKDKHDE